MVDERSEVGRLLGFKNFVCYCGKLEFNAFIDRKPMKLSKCDSRRQIVSKNETGGHVLNALKFMDISSRGAVKK